MSRFCGSEIDRNLKTPRIIFVCGSSGDGKSELFRRICPELFMDSTCSWKNLDIASQYRCAVCGYDLRLGSIQVALEAAHIKWHQAGGPDLETNGLALCSMHHKLFDRGAFTLTDELQLCVSQKANGSTGLSEWLTSFHGLPLKAPQSCDYLPLNEHLAWHRKEVFHGPGRELTAKP